MGPRPLLLGLLGGGLLAGGVLGACAPTPDRRDAATRAEETGFRGVALSDPSRRADFVLTDTEGRPFDFRANTAGHITLLFFGFTHCPDICPVHMHNMAAVLDDLPYEQRTRFQVVFVSTDPDRDTPERLRAWLDRFDPRFVGLRGDLERVNEIQRQLGLPPAVIQEGAGDDYMVGHASQVLAIAPDGRARLAYPAGIRQADLAHDLPRLAESWLPEEAGSERPEPLRRARQAPERVEAEG